VEDREVELAPYDPAWPQGFAAERKTLSERFGLAPDAVQHVGSTAVPGLAAKPIIDVMVGVPRLAVDPELIDGLKALGYEYFGEFGIPGRHFFRKGHPRTHHLHWVEQGGDFWSKQVLFRDYLLAHPDTVAGYERLKRELAQRFRADRAGYTRSKSAFVEDILVKARRWRGES